MKLFSKNFVLFLAIISLLPPVFIFLPQPVLAEQETEISLEEALKDESLVELNKNDSEEIFKSLIKYLNGKWEDTITSNESDSKDNAVARIILQSAKYHALKYLFYDVGFGGIKSILELAFLMLVQDSSLVIGKIEKFTVDKAKEYVMDWLLQNEIKVSKGNLEYGYLTEDNKFESGVFPYIIVYKPIDKKTGKVAIGIYSSQWIKTPAVRLGMQWEGGIDELPPFIIEIKGEVRESGQSYVWTKGPQINIIFDKPAPDLNFKEPTLKEKFDSFLSKIGNYIGELGGGTKNKVVELGKALKDAWDNFSSFLNKLGLLKASISSVSPIEETEDRREEGLLAGFSAEDIIKQTEEIKQEITEQQFANSRSQSSGGELNMAETQELIDDISEKIDILTQEINDLSGQHGQHNEQEQESSDGESGPPNGELKPHEVDSEESESAEEPTEEPAEEPGEPEIILTTNRTTGSASPSYCSTAGLGEASRDKVIFNEIAWIGTSESSSDEWMELKNISSISVDLSNWQIIDKDSQIKTALTGILPAGSFYLLERGDDNSVKNIAADIVYSGALNNTDETLYLFNGSCQLQDIVEANPDWPAGDNGEKRTMERNSDLTWHNYFGELNNGIMGTPKTENSPPGGEASPFEGEPGPENSEPSSGQIFINEIAWAGTKFSAMDEWIELYNPNEDLIDLTGWKLIFTASGSETPSIDLEFNLIDSATPIINGLSYFLLERTDDSDISDIPADHIYTGALNDSGGVLELKDGSGNLIDQVDCSGGWLGGNKENRISMERDGENWRNNNLIIHNGKDADNNIIWGTPKRENSVVQETLIIGNLPFDEFDEIVLNPQTGKYIVRNNIDVLEGKTLIINPAVSLNFYDEYSRFRVDGTLKAIGEEDDKIIFTSVKENPYPGAWGGIYLNPTSVDSEIDKAIFRYAGGDQWSGRAAIYVDSCSAEIKNSLFEDNMSSSITLVNSDSLVDNVQIIDTVVHCCPEMSYAYDGIAVIGGKPTIRDSLFRNSGYGIIINKDADPVIEDNTFEQNDMAALWLSESSVHSSGNNVFGNAINGIMAIGDMPNPAVWDSDLPFVVRSGLSVYSAELVMVSGTVVKFYDNTSRIVIWPGGTLKAVGEEDDKIIFTSFKDDEYGGDANNNLDASAPVAGDWSGIYSQAGGILDLDNIIVKYAGSLFDWASIWAEDSLISLKNSLIEFNKNSGIFLANATASLDAVQFINNRIGVWIENGSSVISNSTFKNNEKGIYISQGEADLDNLIFGTGDEANGCNVWKINQCFDLAP